MNAEMFVPVFIFFGMVCFVILLVRIAKKAEKKRAADFLSLSQENGYTYQPDDDKSEKFDTKYGFFRLFTTGNRRKAFNIISFQEDSRTVTVFDYTYTTGSGKSQSTHVSTNVIIHQDDRHFPHFFVRREVAVFDYLGKMFGGQDINFDNDEDFSKSFVLQGEEEEQTRELFSYPTNRMPFFAFAEENVTFEAKGQHFHYRHHGQLVVGEFLETVQKVLDLVSSIKT